MPNKTKHLHCKLKENSKIKTRNAGGNAAI